MKSKDIKIILSILILLIAVIVYRRLTATTGQFIDITEAGKYIGSYSLDTNQTIELTNNTVEIKNGNVHMLEANCPDKLCINQGFVDTDNASIICLPNQVVVTVCQPGDALKANGFYFNTYVELTAYNCNDESLLSNALDICAKYENICSRTSADSELYKLNHRLLPLYGEKDGVKYYQVSDELYDMIKIGLYYSLESNGAFNIAIAPVTDLWNFTGGSNVIPSEGQVKAALAYTNYEDIHVADNNLIGFASDKNMIDLGGIAKGYIADVLKEYLVSNNVHMAIISLGHNILCIGDKFGESFKVGIKKPFSENDVITTVDVSDKSVVTSGIFERYFEVDNTIYHHILDSSTGFPIQNDLSSVTIISDSSTQGDALSTLLFSLGSERALEFDRSHDDIDTVLIDRENNIIR